MNTKKIVSFTKQNYFILPKLKKPKRLQKCFQKSKNFEGKSLLLCKNQVGILQDKIALPISIEVALQKSSFEFEKNMKKFGPVTFPCFFFFH